jgi:hypothetical protein
MAIEPLKAVQLYAPCAPELIPYQSTAEVVEPVDVVGQERALAALAFVFAVAFFQREEVLFRS